MVTQKHIAQKLGLSIITVSRALRGHPDLAESTRQKVVNKAIELGYPKLALHTANGIGVRRIGVIPYQGTGGSFFESDFQHRIFVSLESECQKQGVEIVLQFHRPGEIPLFIKNGTVDAVCLMGRYSPELIPFAGKIPVLSVSTYTSGLAVPRVVANNVGGSAEMTEYLIGLGHRKILFLMCNDSSSLTSIFTDRANGYRMAMACHGLEPHVLSLENVEENVKKLDGYTAVFCANDASAMTLLKLLESQKIAVPEKLSVASFDNLRDSDKLGLTTYAPDCDAMGRMAALLLVFQPKELLRTEFQLTVSGKIMERRTTAKI